MIKTLRLLGIFSMRVTPILAFLTVVFLAYTRGIEFTHVVLGILLLAVSIMANIQDYSRKTELAAEAELADTEYGYSGPEGLHPRSAIKADAMRVIHQQRTN